MLWQYCEVTWPDSPKCERRGIVRVQLEDGDEVLACLEDAQAVRTERIGLVRA
jgi:hypothetical protein